MYVLLKSAMQGHVGGSVGWASDFGSGHNLMVLEFEPRIRLCAVSSQPASDPLSPSLSLSALPTPHILSLKNKKTIKKKKCHAKITKN